MFPFVSKIMNRDQKNKLILCAFAVFLAIVISSALLFSKKVATSHSPKNIVSRASASSSDVSSACAATLYPNACETALASIQTKSRQDLFSVSVQFTMGKVRSARRMAHNTRLLSSQKLSSGKTTGTDDCIELLDATLDHLKDVMDKKASHHDIKTWLSAALTYQTTCSECLQTVESSGGDALNAQVQSLLEFISNSLALYKHLKDNSSDEGMAVGGGRKLLSGDGRFPTWLSAGDRKLLEASPADIKPHAVVARDGSGTHKTIGEALAFVSLASGGGGGRTVIYIKAGTYKEHINIPTKQKNVMLMGDGKGKSVIVGSKSAGSGATTYNSATVAAMGAGFIAKDLTIINDSGPAKHQAVALRVGSDKSVVYGCSLQGYQDTLYTLSNRQFYSQNDIYGTVDFIFGNSAVVIQNCFIQPRRPGSGQKNSITAQGRSDPNQNTGISIQKCTIQGSSDLGSTPTYLGRPWKKYARVVVMESSLDRSINPAGWEQWSGNFALSTLYYGEYANTGPGASTSGRVRWPGVHPTMSSADASKFTVANFIFGDYWLPGTGASYTSGL